VRRWLVALLVLLAVTVLVSPGIIGRLAQNNLERALPGATTYGEDDYVVTRESFERGWFTAEGRYRIDIRRGGVRHALLALAGLEPHGAVPALIVDTRIDHGLVPVTSMSRESGTLRPVLASTVSTVALALGDGEPVTMPGRLYSNIGLNGDTASRYRLEAGSFEHEELAADWEGADISFTFDAAGRFAQYAGRMQPFVVRSHADTVRADGLRFEGDVDKTGIGLHVGSLTLQGGAASVATDSFGMAAVEALDLHMESSLDHNERLRGAASMSVTALDLPEDEAPADLRLELAIERIDTRALAAVIAELRQAQARAAAGDAGRVGHAALESGLQRLLSAGGELRVDSLEVTVPQGKVTCALRFELPETDVAEPYSWPSLLLALSASADVELSVAIVEALLEAHPDMQGLLAAGILQREGDVYAVEAEYAQGIVTVNGAPLPVPLPGREAPVPR
jgi:uncharacterized protein YdgA (DUF945 family)